MSLSRPAGPARPAALVPFALLAGLAALILIISGCTVPVPTGSAGEIGRAHV